MKNNVFYYITNLYIKTNYLFKDIDTYNNMIFSYQIQIY